MASSIYSVICSRRKSCYRFCHTVFICTSILYYGYGWSSWWTKFACTATFVGLRSGKLHSTVASLLQCCHQSEELLGTPCKRGPTCSLVFPMSSQMVAISVDVNIHTSRMDPWRLVNIPSAIFFKILLSCWWFFVGICQFCTKILFVLQGVVTPHVLCRICWRRNVVLSSKYLNDLWMKGCMFPRSVIYSKLSA